jgi:hypothetical protein
VEGVCGCSGGFTTTKQRQIRSILKTAGLLLVEKRRRIDLSRKKSNSEPDETWIGCFGEIESMLRAYESTGLLTLLYRCKSVPYLWPDVHLRCFALGNTYKQFRGISMALETRRHRSGEMSERGKQKMRGL